MTRPTVTVAVPVLDEERHIDACLDAIERQTYPPLEVLVIDGGSSDGTMARAACHAVRLLHNPGTPAARSNSWVERVPLRALPATLSRSLVLAGYCEGVRMRYGPAQEWL